MATQSSRIEWTESTWNPVRGCTRVSEGCRFCYAERIAARFSGKGLAYEGFAENTKAEPQWTKEVRLIPELLNEPLKWKKSRRIFVNSMSDLFHFKPSANRLRVKPQKQTSLLLHVLDVRHENDGTIL